MTRLPPRWLRLAAWASQGINVAVFNGHHDETVSGRAYREGILLGDPAWTRRCRVLDRAFRAVLGQDGHCRASHQMDVEFAAVIRAPAGS